MLGVILYKEQETFLKKGDAVKKNIAKKYLNELSTYRCLTNQLK